MFKTVMATIPATDLERAKAWYRDKLGLEPKQDIGGEGGAVYSAGDAQFLLYQSQFAGTNQATAASWVVDDLEATVKDLRSRGVTFEEYDFPGLTTVDGIAETPEGKGAWFKDSEGNILAVSDMAM